MEAKSGRETVNHESYLLASGRRLLLWKLSCLAPTAIEIFIVAMREREL
jgi:hypothetical protein